MKNFRQFFVKTAIFFFLLTTTTPAFAWDSKGVKEARNFIDVGRNDQAIQILVNWTNQEAKDFDAYWMLAGLYMTNGQYGQAEEQFNYALRLKTNKQGEVIEKFKIAFKHELSKGNISVAKNLAQTVIDLEPSYKRQAYQEFYNNGKKISGQNAVDNFRIALAFATTRDEREKVGKQYLKLALDDPRLLYVVPEASNIVGQEVVDQIIPSQRTETIFSHTYTDADLGNDSTVEIIDYTKTHVLQGDELVIRTTMPDNADKVKVSSSSGDWIPISKNGEFKMTHNNSPTLGNKGILFSKGQGVKVRVDLVRVVKIKTNYALLANL